ncbi:uncharacterized protein LOC108195059 [Daucus carota subsp. sativus]|uniref:uncharacterized protein LOC108195059 n=1 Tax=Daucus carota subsp. sativus TaxID=79200 RepID=UPI003083BC40
MFSSEAPLLQQDSEFLDIQVVDMQFYGHEIANYEKELKIAGVMFEVNEACRFKGNQLMSIAASSNLTGDSVLSILKFIKFLRAKLISPAEFIKSIKGGQWLRTSQGDRSPGESVLYNKEWKPASEVSNIPFIDEFYYGTNLNCYKKELELIGVKVKFNGNYQLVGDNLNSSACSSSLTPGALCLILECLRQSKSTDKFVYALKDKECIKTHAGFKTPSECYLLDSERGCLLQVFSCFPLIDENFYGSKILSFKDELEQIGVVVDFGELSTSNAFPANLKECIREVKWLCTRLGDYRAPADCILFGQCWKSISSISSLPFVDDSDNQYGMTIHENDEELRSIGVVSSFNDGAHFVVNGLNFPQDLSRITPENVYSLLDCVRNYRPKIGNVVVHERFPSTFFEKVSTQWLKSYTGYRTPNKCMLFSPKWAAYLERSDGPFLDEDFYGSTITEYTSELRSLGVIVEIDNGCSLLANYLDLHSNFTAVSRIYNFLIELKWKPNDEDNKNIWIPSGSENGHWVSSEDCVIQDKNGLLGSRLHVLERHYESKLLDFFSITYGVKLNPYIDNYCEIWKTWEASDHQLTHNESCAFWGFVTKNWSSRTAEILTQQLLKLPVYSGSNAIILVNKQDQKLSAVDTISLRQLNPKELFIGKGLLRLILGFLADIWPNMEADIRHNVVRGLLDVTVLEARKKITMCHTLSLSSGKILTVKAKQMLRWERQISKLFVQKLDKHGGHKNFMEYVSQFSEVVAGGLLWEDEVHMHQLADLIRMGFLVEFNEEAVMYLMKTKNLQVFLEDEELLSSTFPDD